MCLEKLKMLREEPSPETRLQICDGNEEELHFMSIREKENFRYFRALKKSSNDDSVPAQSSKSKPLIQRVPFTLSEKKNFKKYFEPRVVAIGPLHHGNRRLQPAEKAKLKLAVLFTEEHRVAEHVLYKKIKQDIGYLKKCYKPEDIEDYDDEELAWMFFVDGCAVLKAIHYSKSKQEKQKDELNIKVDILAFAQVDLFMLENQLPFRVLELLISSVHDGKDLRESIDVFIDNKIKRTIAEGKKGQPRQDQDRTHLLGLLRERLLAETNNKNKSTKTIIGKLLLSCGAKQQQYPKTFRSINELKEAGIRVTPSETSSLRDVNFYVGFLGTLKIPRIVVDDSTGSKFMNLVAYEMCPDFKNEFEVTSYLCFLDSLIDTAQDVKELRHAGMLLNYLGSDQEVADLFNNITTDLVPDLEMYHDVTDKIRKYCDNPWTTCIAKAYYTHFSTPWSFLGFLGALMGLLFTAIQAYYSMRKATMGQK
ncbi:UPF0481 protein At3g47200-like [Durio zibethinus]|uniref:UPF0481 protein At3g47200-like n=1 Tax=Durio zibethinus TaxID=66656 RepID=A0A6P5YVK5_DURZI|nr:UPF0481 protein At3g47200-like [Durio zibethinus]